MSDTSYKLGAAAWHDLTVPNAAEVATFYTTVLNVTMSPVPMGTYSDFNLIPDGDQEPVAGVCHARGRNAGLPAAWLTYFVVADLSESLRACEEHGGKLLAGPSSAGGGTYAVIEDPAGATCALFALHSPESGQTDAPPHELDQPDDIEVVVGVRTAPSGDTAASDDQHAAEWRPESASADLVEEVIFASLLVASGGEGDIDGAELRTIMNSLGRRFSDLGADLRLEALARAIERFTMAPVAEITTSIADLGGGLPRAGRRAILADLGAVALADGAVHPMERTLLRHIAEAWGLPSPVPEETTD